MRRIACEILLGGGLGNQLFQYAFGRSLSLRSNARLVLDRRTLFQSDARYRRTFELGHFSLPDECVLREPLPGLQKLRIRMGQKLSKNRTLEKSVYMEEPRPGIYDARFRELKLRRSCLIKGYWHCPLYFEDYAATLKTDLEFRAPVADAHRDLASAIGESISVGVHVRRSDFWSTLDFAYYRNAMEIMAEHHPGARFFIFTDAPDWWMGKAGSMRNIHLVSGPARKGIEDFQLLSGCRHFIIANSSFSWWAAWLGRHPDKEVIAPSEAIWFDSWSVLPPEWLTIPVKKDPASEQPGVSSFNFVPVD